MFAQMSRHNNSFQFRSGQLADTERETSRLALRVLIVLAAYQNARSKQDSLESFQAGH
jgi:hypothetical protein